MYEFVDKFVLEYLIGCYVDNIDIKISVEEGLVEILVFKFGYVIFFWFFVEYDIDSDEGVVEDGVVDDEFLYCFFVVGCRIVVCIVVLLLVIMGGVLKFGENVVGVVFGFECCFWGKEGILFGWLMEGVYCWWGFCKLYC